MVSESRRFILLIYNLRDCLSYINAIILNFISDMINMMKLNYVPQCAEWIHSFGDAISTVAM